MLSLLSTNNLFTSFSPYLLDVMPVGLHVVTDVIAILFLHVLEYLMSVRQGYLKGICKRFVSQELNIKLGTCADLLILTPFQLELQFWHYQVQI